MRAGLLSMDKAARQQLLLQKDEGGWTLFHLACQLGKLQLAFALLDLGADVNATTPNGATGLHFLALLSKEEASPPAVYLQLLAELLRKGASLGLLNAAGESLLHMSASRKNEVAAGFFIEAGCDLNVQTKQGETALHYAVAQNCPSVVSLLLSKGALDRPNCSLITAEQMAKSKLPEIANLFELQRKNRGSSSAGSSGVSLRSHRPAAEPRPSARSMVEGVSTATASVPSTPTVAAAEEIVVWTVPEADPFADESEEEEEARDGVVAGLEGLSVNGSCEAYRNEFFGKRHFVYHGLAAESEERVIAVVLSRPGSDGQYRGLLVAAGDWTVFSFSAELLALYAAAADEAEQIRQALAATRPADCARAWTLFRSSPHVASGALLLALEAKLATRPRFCVGVVLGLPGQTKEAEMFENSTMPPEFDAFLGCLGERIEVSSWKHWRGTFAAGEEQAAYYTSWRGFEFVFHVSTLMDATKQRQHIGNDTVLIFYKLGSDKIESQFRGKVNACALIATPSDKQGNKSITFSAFYRRWIEGFAPSLPYRAVSLSSVVRDVLLTNIVNCSFAAVKSGPYKQNRARLYDAACAELVASEESAVSGGAVSESEPRVNLRSPSPAAAAPRKKPQAAPPEKAVVVTAEKAVVAVVPALEELKSGWLLKRKIKAGKKASAWKRRFCILREDGLSYYAQEGDEQRMGLISFSLMQALELHTSPPLLGLRSVQGEYDLGSELQQPSQALAELRAWGLLLAARADLSLVTKEVSSVFFFFSCFSDVLFLKLKEPKSAPSAPANSNPPPPRPAAKRAANNPVEEVSGTGSAAVLPPEKMTDLIIQAIHYIHRKGKKILVFFPLLFLI